MEVLPLVGIVKDDAKRVSLSRSQTAHSVPKIDAIDPSRTLNRPVMHCERHRVSLAKWNHLWPRLHPRPLLREHELAAGEIFLWLREHDRNLDRENVFAIEILVEATEITDRIEAAMGWAVVVQRRGISERIRRDSRDSVFRSQ